MHANESIGTTERGKQPGQATACCNLKEKANYFFDCRATKTGNFLVYADEGVLGMMQRRFACY